MSETNAPDYVVKPKVYQIEIGGEVCEVRKPLYKEAKAIMDRSKLAGEEDGIDITISELVKLGMPADMGDKVSLDDIVEIAGIIFGSKKK